MTDIGADAFHRSHIELYEQAFVSKHVKVNGCKYLPGNIVAAAFGSDERPVLGKISLLVNNNKRCILLLHLHAYELDFADTVSLHDGLSVADPHKLRIVSGYGKYSKCTVCMWFSTMKFFQRMQIKNKVFDSLISYVLT